MNSQIIQTDCFSEKSEVETAPAVGYAIELDGLTKQYGSQVVVDRLTLSVPKGSVFGLIGANGAGKSTTLKMLIGMLSPTSGSGMILGEQVGSASPELLSRVGYVPEVHNIYSWMTVDSAIWFTRKLHPRWNDRTCDDLLKRFNLERGKKIKSLSKGMLAKLALVLAISHEPELLILDEPMSGLDPIVREEFLDGVLASACHGGVTVILSSHSIDDVQRMSDSIGLIDRGHLLIHRTVDEILQRTRKIRAVLKEGAMPEKIPESMICQKVSKREWVVTVDDFSESMLQKLTHQNPVEQVEVEGLNLEEIFKEYVRGRR